MERFGYGEHRRAYLRGLHYAIVSQGDVVKPNGAIYRNTEKDWTWLQSDASKAARWLRYVPLEHIRDQRNEAPVIHRRRAPDLGTFVSVGVEVEIPDVDELTPTVGVYGFEGRQAYHYVFFGEKSGLEEALGPIAQRFGCDLYLPSGEISDTLLYQMAADGAADGRPMLVFTFADFDPAGRQMPVSIGRKLQGLRDLYFSGLEFEVRPVALEVEQVRELELPSTPLKESERRADRWREAFGCEQTEVDALATLRPDVLRRIAEEAIAPFYDKTLERRVTDARRAWRERAQAALNAQVDADLLERLRAEAATKLHELESEIALINAQLRTATDDLDVLLPAPIVPDPVLNGEGASPLISSRWDWAEASRSLLTRKTYGNGGER